MGRLRAQRFHIWIPDGIRETIRMYQGKTVNGRETCICGRMWMSCPYVLFFWQLNSWYDMKNLRDCQTSAGFWTKTELQESMIPRCQSKLGYPLEMEGSNTRPSTPRTGPERSSSRKGSKLSAKSSDDVNAPSNCATPRGGSKSISKTGVFRTKTCKVARIGSGSLLRTSCQHQILCQWILVYCCVCHSSGPWFSPVSRMKNPPLFVRWTCRSSTEAPLSSQPICEGHVQLRSRCERCTFQAYQALLTHDSVFEKDDFSAGITSSGWKSAAPSRYFGKIFRSSGKPNLMILIWFNWYPSPKDQESQSNEEILWCPSRFIFWCFSDAVGRSIRSINVLQSWHAALSLPTGQNTFRNAAVRRKHFQPFLPHTFSWVCFM